eukprot:GEMP01055527.1.p1 GENE.GEMP01055527.1~~GEMP01055527.1.p1  ORF type:complete len:101 (+),score=0.38 GEMP01055527.1:59-361(+)
MLNLDGCMYFTPPQNHCNLDVPCVPLSVSFPPRHLTNKAMQLLIVKKVEIYIFEGVQRGTRDQFFVVRACTCIFFCCRVLHYLPTHTLFFGCSSLMKNNF